MNMVAQTISERTVLVEGDIAVVFGTAGLRFAAGRKEDTTSVLRYSTTYVKREGRWRMLALHMTKRASDSQQRFLSASQLFAHPELSGMGLRSRDVRRRKGCAGRRSIRDSHRAA